MEQGTTKAKILREAIDLISQIGYEQMSMRMLAANVGIKAASIYNYFSGKEQILHEIMEFVSGALRIKQYTDLEVGELLQIQSPETVLCNYTALRPIDDYHTLLKLYRLLYIEQYRNNTRLRELTRRFLLVESIDATQELLDILVHARAIPETDTFALANVWYRTALLFCLESTLFYTEGPNPRYYEVMDFFAQCAIRGVKPIQSSVSFTFAPQGDSVQALRDAAKDTPQRLAVEALLLIDQKGGDQVSLRDICNAAGIQTGSFYNHYESKEALIIEIVRQINQRTSKMKFSREAIQQALISRDIDATVAALSGCNAPMNEEMQVLPYRVKFREQYRNDTMRDICWESTYQHISEFTQALEEAQRQGLKLPAKPWIIATAYKFAVSASVHISCSMFEEDIPESEDLRNRMGGWFLGLVFGE